MPNVVLTSLTDNLSNSMWLNLTALKGSRCNWNSGKNMQHELLLKLCTAQCIKDRFVFSVEVEACPARYEANVCKLADNTFQLCESWKEGDKDPNGREEVKCQKGHAQVKCKFPTQSKSQQCYTDHCSINCISTRHICFFQHTNNTWNNSNSISNSWVGLFTQYLEDMWIWP